MPLPANTPSPAEPVPAEYDQLCEGCGYSLIGLTDINRCPECGREFDPTQLPLARVPWLYRSRLGKGRAYRRTLWQILADRRGFAKELCRPVRISVIDAQLFRRRVIDRTVFAAAVFVVLVVAIRLSDQIPLLNAREIVLAIVAFAAGILCLLLFLSLATNLPTFIWKGLPANPNDLAPIHHYACAPLCLVPPFGLVVFLFVMLTDPRLDFGGGVVYPLLLGGAFAMLIATSLWYTAVAFMRAATACRRRELLKLALYLPLHWILSAAMAVLIWLTVVYYTAQSIGMGPGL